MPMDFTTMRRNLNAGMYSSWESLQSDLELMFQVAAGHLLAEHFLCIEFRV